MTVMTNCNAERPARARTPKTRKRPDQMRCGSSGPATHVPVWGHANHSITHTHVDAEHVHPHLIEERPRVPWEAIKSDSTRSAPAARRG